MSVSIRSARPDDFDEILRVEVETWSEELVSPAAIRNAMGVFPQGYFCACPDGRVAGAFTTILISYDLPIATWHEITAGGSFATHDPSGNALFGAALSVSREFRGLRIGTCLVERAKQFVIEKRLDFLVLGSRIPRDLKYPGLDVLDYVHLLNAQGERLDP
jgi:predicted N-acetyltransferase YhbS